MNLEQFAKDAGVTIHSCNPEWGGVFGYQTKDSPNCRYNGYKTEASAYKGWLKNHFGEETSKAIIKLLKQTERRKKATK